MSCLPFLAFAILMPTKGSKSAVKLGIFLETVVWRNEKFTRKEIKNIHKKL